jgi:hypothetical protein
VGVVRASARGRFRLAVEIRLDERGRPYWEHEGRRIPALRGGAGSLTNYGENALANAALGSTAIWANLYLAAFTATLDDATTGSTAGEPSGNAYARAAVAQNTTMWPDATNGQKTNGQTISFPEATGAWGDITHVAMVDATSAGNAICWADLDEAKTIGNGDELLFDPGDLVFTLT